MMRAVKARAHPVALDEGRVPFPIGVAAEPFNEFLTKTKEYFPATARPNFVELSMEPIDRQRMLYIAVALRSFVWLLVVFALLGLHDRLSPVLSLLPSSG